jgi:predicted acylesterase/phospholipase RssA
LRVICEDGVFYKLRAVFEGGGVRGAAYAGAYKGAVAAGIRFNGVAGSSAGAIAAALIAAALSAAALIAAGGTPDAIAAELLKTDLSMLQTGVTDKDIPFAKSTFVGGVLRGVPFGAGKKVGQIVCYSGIYNSSAVRQWVEETLREFLNATGFRAVDRPIRFAD